MDKEKTAYRRWMDRRNQLVEEMRKASVWVMEPYGERVRYNRGEDWREEVLDMTPAPVRSFLALQGDRYAAAVTAFATLAAERTQILEQYGKAADSTRRMWLPVFLPPGWRKIVYQSNAAHETYPSAVKTLIFEEMVDGKPSREELDVAAFLDARGWTRDQVTIRRQSGASYPGLYWPAEGKPVKIPTHCVIAESEDSAGDDVCGKVYRTAPRSGRVDALPACDRWHRFEFVVYPDANAAPKRLGSRVKPSMLDR
jgi:hypothetical protein